MRLIRDNQTNIVAVQTDADITEENGVYLLGGTSCGVSSSENNLVENATECTYQQFFAYTFTYIDGVWGIGSQELYDANMGFITAQASNEVIAKRDALLYASDWTQIPNNPLTPAEQQSWATYRQELRDVTSEAGYPFNVTWPIAPKKAAANQPETTGLQTA